MHPDNNIKLINFMTSSDFQQLITCLVRCCSMFVWWKKMTSRLPF